MCDTHKDDRITPDTEWYRLVEHNNVYEIRKDNEQKLCILVDELDAYRVLTALNLWTEHYILCRYGHMDRPLSKESKLIILNRQCRNLQKELLEKELLEQELLEKTRALQEVVDSAIEDPPWYLRMALWLYEKLNR